MINFILKRAKYNRPLMVCVLLFIANLCFAEVPVVDDSENYALLEEQTINAPSSVQNSSNNEGYYENERALAHENNDQASINNSFSNSDDDVKNLRQEVQELRSQVEVLDHELKKLKDQQLAFYKDLDARIPNNQPMKLSGNETDNNPEPSKDPSTEQPIQALKSVEKPKVSFNSANENYASSNTSPADEQISYLQAYEHIKNKQFSQAVSAMQNFVTKYPNGSYSANAEYWLGELYLAEKNYPSAISHFDAVLQKYPTSNKSSASLLKLGYALAESGRLNEAKLKLNEVMQKYPDTNTSELARNKLKEISSNI